LFDETTVDAIVDARDALLASQSRVLEQIAPVRIEPRDARA
jgi:hypothetical protein